MSLYRDGADGAEYVGFHDLAETHRQEIKDKWRSNEPRLRYVERLAQLGSPLTEGYRASLTCQAMHLINERGPRSKFHCGRPWCPNCRVTQFGDRYYPYIDGLRKLSEEGKELYFLTLTTRRFQACQLEGRVQDMLSARTRVLNQIREKARRQGSKLQCFWKVECAVDRLEGRPMFRPHIHLIVEGEANAEAILDRWCQEYMWCDRGDHHLVRIVKRLGGKYGHLSGVERSLAYLSKGIVDHNTVRPEDADVIYQAFQGVHAHGGSRSLRTQDTREKCAESAEQLPDIGMVIMTLEGLVDGVTGELISGSDLSCL